MPRAWSEKRERQFEHIKESYRERGRSEEKAEELAARTVNKERARKGETETWKGRSSESVKPAAEAPRGRSRSR
jgi:hypothetical protein